MATTARDGLRSALQRRFGDVVLLQPSTHAVDVTATQRFIRYDGGRVQAWQFRSEATHHQEPRVFVLHFHGIGGRGELEGRRFVNLCQDAPTELWAVNAPGFGRSTGPATLRSMPLAARASLLAIAQAAGGRPILLSGHSLGSAIALHLARWAAEQPAGGDALNIAGLVLRNPPPLAELLHELHGWWNFRWLSRKVAASIPADFDSVANAAHVRLPAVVMTSALDIVVPPPFQQRVINAYAGPLVHVRHRLAGHNAPLRGGWLRSSREALQRLMATIDDHRTTAAVSNAAIAG